MKLQLDRITKQVGAETHLYPTSLAPTPGALTVLLGATRAGKTSLMRIMAGLDAPTTGRVLVDDLDVTGRPVRERNIAMVYQQFINYPSLTVAENIASPLRRRPGAGARKSEIDAQVRAVAGRLRIDALLDRLPAALSGGQQQRVALARALVKRAPLVLLDEPLVNLDYKLREELREELSQLFATGESTVVYATTDPSEALLLGGYTAVLDRGELLQYGPTADVFHAPASLRVARAFSDPPMNLMPATASHDGRVALSNGVQWVVPSAARDGTPEGACTLGVRAAALRLDRSWDAHGAGVGDERAPSLAGTVSLADIAGSDTFVHVETAVGNVIVQLPGVHRFALGESVMARFDAAQLYLFGGDGMLLHAPARAASRSAERAASFVWQGSDGATARGER